MEYYMGLLEHNFLNILLKWNFWLDGCNLPNYLNILGFISDQRNIEVDKN